MLSKNFVKKIIRHRVYIFMGRSLFLIYVLKDCCEYRIYRANFEQIDLLSISNLSYDDLLDYVCKNGDCIFRGSFVRDLRFDKYDNFYRWISNAKFFYRDEVIYEQPISNFIEENEYKFLPEQYVGQVCNTSVG